MAEGVRTGDEESPLKEYLDQAEREVDLKRSNEEIARENSRLKLQLEVLYSEMRAARAQASLDRVLREQETVVQTPTSTPVPPDPGEGTPGGRENSPDPGSAEKPADTSGNLSAAEEQLVDRWTQVFVQRMSPAVTRGNRRCQACGGNMADFPPVTRGNTADFPPVTRGNRRCQACRALEENLSDSVLAAAPERGAGRRVSAAEDHLLDRWADRLAERLLSFSQPQVTSTPLKVKHKVTSTPIKVRHRRTASDGEDLQTCLADRYERRLAECLADTSLPVVPCGEAEQGSPYTPGGASSRDHDTESPCQMCWEAANDSLAAVQARIRRDSSTAPSESEPALQRTAGGTRAFATPGESRGRCSHSARACRPGCTGCLRVVGELAFQLDMQILQYVFQRRRLYGFTLRNIEDKIREAADKEVLVWARHKVEE
ncbi:PREDICTED: uncharacterized protein LOC109479348 [Branchiostoma belcheri]|uniref:Uncharacterized protein LOC109479348 n=1 Tax=Branchiostoma belcheri TaxID=7741 RepID=A0A6P4ZJC3_BRABE|nr:PREDICTED: uncharacterized protein LOC109479348 [Branchiostoma belcheri]